MIIENMMETLRFETDSDEIAILTINRPAQLNALNSTILRELEEVFIQLENLEFGKIKGLILTGEENKAFIAGADIKEMSSMSADDAKCFASLGQKVTLAFESAKFPVIAAVNGYALGGGFEMALGADFILATKNAQFGLPEVKLGLIPGFGGTQRLARVIGRNKARELIYLGRNIEAEEALKMGLIDSIFNTKDEMLDHAKSLLVKISKNSSLAIGSAKKAINSGIDLDLNSALNMELNCFSELFFSEDAKEGMCAFVEKRGPQFKGK